MKFGLPLFVLFAVLAVVPVWAQEGHAAASEEAHTAEGHADGEHGNALGGENAALWKSINFAVLIAGVIYLLRGKVGPFFAQHNRSIAEGMAVADERDAAAKARLAAIEVKLAGLDAEIAGLREHAAVEMERDRERIEHETAVAIERLQERAESEIASSVAQAKAQLRHQAAMLALNLAERQVRTEAQSGDLQNQLLKQATERLAGAGDAQRN